MPATHDAFKHFIETGEMKDLIPTPRGDSMPTMTPYFTYEVGTDEPPHPDMDIAARFIEVAISDCKYGCKIYADPFSEVRVLVHSAVYGCRKTMEALAKDREDGKIRPGDTVEFDPYDDELVTFTGKVLNYLPADDTGFRGGFHIGCYYIVPEKDVRATSPGETYQQGYTRLWKEGRTEEQIAAYFSITVEALRAMRLKEPQPEMYDGSEFKPGDMVKFKWLDDDDIHVGQIISYNSPQLDSEEFPDGTYGGYHIRTNERDPASGNIVYYKIDYKGALTLAE